MNSCIRHSSCALVAIVLAVLPSCETLKSVAPVGSEPVALDPARWEGEWVEAYGNSAYRVRVYDAEKGLLLVTTRSSDEDAYGKTEGALVECLAHIRSFGNWTFISLGGPPDKPTPSYVFGRALMLEDEFLVWLPSDSKFKSLRKDKEIPFVMKNDEGELVPYTGEESEEKGRAGNWIVGPLSDEHLLRLTRDPREEVFSRGARRFIRVDPDALP